MSRIFEKENITYTKTLYNLIPYEKEINETITKVVGRKCDRCNHIFKDTEIYYFIMLSQEYEYNSTDKDVCIKCIESECKDYILESKFDSLSIVKSIN